jgi:hypothetical protein
MLGFNRSIPFVALAALTGVSCAFPTDKSDQVFVTLEAPSGVVLRGQEVSVLARAWRVVGTDTQPITNVDFQFASGSGTIASIQKDCCGYATVTGVNSGIVNVFARAVAFENAPQAALAMRVSNPLEIDSVRPATAHHGEVITVYGVGVDSMFLASLSDVTLIEYPFSRFRDPSTGLGRISFWIPPPARADKLFYLGAGVFGQAQDSTQVVFADVFEPNDSVPANIDVDLGGPWPGTVLAPILFTNPALAFEPVERATSGEDWFRFATSDSTRALTFFITYPTFGDTNATRTFLIDSVGYLVGVPGDPVEKFFAKDSVDFVGSDFSRCKGDEFDPAQVTRESTTVALKTLPSHAIHILTFYTKPQRYGLTVADGYFTADPRIKADAFEENDLCRYADDQRITIPSRASGLPGFSDTLNIDNPFEMDWYRIEVPAPAIGDSVRFRLQSRPFIAGRDSSDIDIYVLTVPGSTGSGVFEIASSLNLGSTENFLVDLPAGSYYVAVVDYAGVAMRYSMCIRQVPATGIRTCNLILPGPPAAMTPKPHPQLSTAVNPTAGRSPFMRGRRP